MGRTGNTLGKALLTLIGVLINFSSVNYWWGKREKCKLTVIHPSGIVSENLRGIIPVVCEDALSEMRLNTTSRNELSKWDECLDLILWPFPSISLPTVTMFVGGSRCVLLESCFSTLACLLSQLRAKKILKEWFIHSFICLFTCSSVGFRNIFLSKCFGAKLWRYNDI